MPNVGNEISEIRHYGTKRMPIPNVICAHVYNKKIMICQNYVVVSYKHCHVINLTAWVSFKSYTYNRGNILYFRILIRTLQHSVTNKTKKVFRKLLNNRLFQTNTQPLADRLFKTNTRPLADSFKWYIHVPFLFQIIPIKCAFNFIIYKVVKYRNILMNYNVYFIFSLVKIPEDQWPCKRSPDIWASYKHKLYKTWKKQGKEMTFTFNTHLLTFTELVVCIYKFSGHWLQ